jgi:hypothetical protein
MPVIGWFVQGMREQAFLHTVGRIVNYDSILMKYLVISFETNKQIIYHFSQVC